jgi:hypothetical protein
LYRTKSEIDVVFLDPADNTAVALCEYENKRHDTKENVLKFEALFYSNQKFFRPKLCLLSFHTTYRRDLEDTNEELLDLIKKIYMSMVRSGWRAETSLDS